MEPSCGQSVPFLVSRQWVTNLCAKLGERFWDCAGVVPLKKRSTDICLPLNNCGSPPVLQHAVLFLLCMSDVPPLRPRGVSPHIFYGEWVECATLFPFPSQQRHLSHPKTQNNKRIVLQICHMAAPHWGGLSSVIWFGKSWLSPPVLDCGYAKYASQCCAHNMWQETSQTDADVLTRLWRASTELLMSCGWMLELQTLQSNPKR